MRFSSALSNQKFPFADPAALNPMTTPPLPEQIELHRDRMWRRDEDLRVESAVDAERFIEDVGFANTLTDARRAGPSFPSRRGGGGVFVCSPGSRRGVEPGGGLVVDAQRAIGGGAGSGERLADRDGDGAAFTDRFDDALLRWV